MWLGCFIIAYFIVRWWQGAYAQAGSELRRARQAWARELRGRMDAGWQAGPGASPWWWPAAAHRAWRGMRGPRPGSTRPSSLPHSTPWRRIWAAGWAHGRRGAAQARARAGGLGPGRAIAGLAAGVAGALATAGGFAAGLLTGRRPRRPGLQLAACDDCGAIVNRAALIPVPRQVGGHTETWMLCPQCALAARSQPPGPGPQPQAQPDPQPQLDPLVPPGPQTGQGGPDDPAAGGGWGGRGQDAPQPVWTTGPGLVDLVKNQEEGIRIRVGGAWRTVTAVGYGGGDGAVLAGLDGEPGAWHRIGPLEAVQALPPGPEPAPGLRAAVSPDFDAYAAGQIDASQVRCLSCGQAPCQCTGCPAPYRRWGQPEPEPCGMRAAPGRLCPRGHTPQPQMLTVRSRTGQPLGAVVPGDPHTTLAVQTQDPGSPSWFTVPVWSADELNQWLREIDTQNQQQELRGGPADLQVSLTPPELLRARGLLPQPRNGTHGQEDTQDMPTGTVAVPDANGESYTHGQWHQVTAAIHQALEQLGPALDAMLGSLSTADAGRSQVTGVMDLNDQARAWADMVRDMLTQVNTAEMPVVEAVAAAGGPAEIAGIPYYEEV
jgi:hypothetical protein